MAKRWKRTMFIVITIISVIVMLEYFCFGSTTRQLLPTNHPLCGFPTNQTVIFLETSGKGTLDLRQLASVESAARFIPNSTVVVLVFTDGNYQPNSHMKILEKVYNVQFNRASFNDFISGTPLEPWYKKGIWRSSPFVVSHMSDALRYLSLWKYGGIYLDLDVILTRMWDVKDNTVITEVEGLLGSAVLVFKKEHPVMLSCLAWLENNYQPFEWAVNGPTLITDKVSEYMRKFYRKDNIYILPVSTFYEINFTEFYKLFNVIYTEEVLKRTESSFGVHVWNKLSAEIAVPKKSSCAYNIILNSSSPIIYVRMQASQV